MTTTTSLELLVFAAASLALGFALWSLCVSHTDHLVLRRLQQNGIKRLTIHARLVRDIARVLCAGVMLAAAAYCLHLPPDTHRVAIVLKVAVLATSVFLAVAVISDFRWRRLIDQALEDADNDRSRA